MTTHNSRNDNTQFSGRQPQFHVALFQTRSLSRCAGASGAAPLAWLPWWAGCEPNRVHHALYRRLDAGVFARHAFHHAAAKTLPPILADQLPQDAWPVRVFLRLPAHDDL